MSVSSTGVILGPGRGGEETANLGLVEERPVVGEDPFVLLEGWLRRVLGFDLVLLLLLLVAGPAARVGIGGAAHGFDAIRFASHRRGRGDWKRTGARRQGTVGQLGQAEGDEDQPTVIIPEQWAVFLCLDRGEAQLQLPALQVRKEKEKIYFPSVRFSFLNLKT